MYSDLGYTFTLCFNNIWDVYQRLKINYDLSVRNGELYAYQFYTLNFLLQALGPPSLLSNGYQGLFPWG